MELPITSALAGAAAIFLVLLSLPIANRRRTQSISYGDGGDTKFNNWIRAQGNFIEYVPIALIVIGLVEMGGYQQILVCGLAAALALGRLLHAFGLIAGALIGRILGMILTWSTLLVAGGLLVYGQLVWV